MPTRRRLLREALQTFGVRAPDDDDEPALVRRLMRVSGLTPMPDTPCVASVLQMTPNVHGGTAASGR